ncbi:Nitrogen regulation protein NR(I), GlnG (=NtrC) [hydrothermal vent metagenome]|uniref:DNA-binding transcriptional regulator NtrC n=1 Tax=hydrothermal vent metagenome TaxID=652676 RepID=A0A3B0RRL6_9ZZZZ
MDGTVLVADDDRTIRTVLTQALTRAGARVHATSSLTTLMRWVAEGRGDVVISDVVMPDGNGLEMLPKIALDRPDLPVIIISAQNTIMTAIQASEAKAYDYLPKPFDLPDLMHRTAQAIKRSVAARGGPAPVANERPEDLPLVGKTPAMQRLYRVIARVMNADMPVLINGESGTGKTLIAKAIHELSDRRSAPFVTVDSGDLEGVDGPARVRAMAGSGTVLLEDIYGLTPDAQGKLVRMIDAPGAGHPRFIATRQHGDGELRDDLYYRLSGLVLIVPPLRERVDDIGLLAAHFSGGDPRLSAAALQAMRQHSWPGNVRQLENVLRRVGLTVQGDEIGAEDILEALGESPDGMARPAVNETLGDSVARHVQRYFDLHGAVLPPAGIYARILREVELPMIEIALESCNGNQAKCADLLGINRNTLRKKITQLDIRVTRRRKMM